MALDGAHILKARGYALQGGAFGFVLLVLALLSLRVGPIDVALTFVPLAGIFMWPQNAAIVMSVCLIFLLGLGLDILSGGPVGLWAFLYLALFGIFRPDLRPMYTGLYPAFLTYLVWIATTLLAIVFVATVFIPGKTLWIALILQAIMALVLFPPIYFTNQFIYKLLTDPDSAEAGV